MDNSAARSDPASRLAQDMQARLSNSLRLIWRGKGLVLACLIVGLVPTILFLTQATPRYAAEVKLIIEGPEASDIAPSNQGPMMRQRPTEATVLTEAEVLGSNLLVRRIIDRLGLASDPEFNRSLRTPTALQAFLGAINPLQWLPLPKSANEELSPQGKDEILKARIARQFSTNLKISSQRRSYVISATFVSENREKAARIANSLADLYVNDRLEANFEDARRVSAWLGERLETLKSDVAVAEEAAERYRSANRLSRKSDRVGERHGTLSDQQLSDISTRLMMARAELAQKQARLDQVNRLTRTQGTVETSVDVLQSQLIQRLREQEAVCQRELSDVMKIYGDRHPRVVGLQAEVAEIHNKINGEIQKVAASVANEVQAAAAGVQTMSSELEALRSQTNAAGGAEIRLRELERQADVSRSLYESFLSRFKRDVDQDQVQRANARIISPATVPTAPSWPPRGQILMAAILLSLGFGVGLVLVLDHVDRTIRSADEAETHTGLKVLAFVPLHHGKTADMATELAERPRSALADAVRGLRVTLDLAENGTPPQLIMVTSSMPKEGKSFVSMCLASAMAKVEKRVLLIDGDLHRPRLHSALNRSAEIGLAQVLAGTSALDDVIHHDVAENLDFLPAGHLNQVADLVHEPLVEPLLAILRGRYDRIILDVPPVLAVSDPRVFGRYADRIVYLIKWKSTPRDAVRSGLRLLAEANVTVDGIVLSQVDQKKYSRYAYGDYGSYYGRYKEYYAE
jgi:capsular exopolysaccharide synthesis family protein